MTARKLDLDAIAVRAQEAAESAERHCDIYSDEYDLAKIDVPALIAAVRDFQAVVAALGVKQKFDGRVLEAERSFLDADWSDPQRDAGVDKEAALAAFTRLRAQGLVE